MALSSLKTDHDAAKDGAWFDYRGLRLRLRYTGANHAEFHKAHRKAIKSLGSRYRKLSDVPDEVWRQAMIPVYARHVVAGWKEGEELPRLTDDGPELDCTAENVARVLCEPGLEWVFTQVVQDAANVDAYLTREDDAKNSETPSAGS